MQLCEIFKSSGMVIPEEWQGFEVSGLCDDSRKVQPGFVFFAHTGTKASGESFINTAMENGARVIVSKFMHPEENGSVLFISTQNLLRTMSDAARVFYEVDFEKIKVVGVTGTNGKTSTVYHLQHLFGQEGFLSGVISTVNNTCGSFKEMSQLTTPSLLDVYRLLGMYGKQGGKYCFMEVSSHGIDQGRVFGIPFRGKILTQVTKDHLDYHHTLAHYESTKEKFFENDDAYYVINSDDHVGRKMINKCTKENKTILTYGTEDDQTHLKISDICIDAKHTSWIWSHSDKTYRASVPFPVGSFMISNFSAAVLVAVHEGVSFDSILKHIQSMLPPRGRFSILKTKEFLVVIDYAHTSDALLKLLKSVRCFAPKRILLVFGCGGNRDKTKRREMGEIASSLSDGIYLTSDNPRFEEPMEIISDIKKGIRKEASLTVISDRQQAIGTALRDAEKGDVVVIAGKGHETYQEIKGVRYPFDDFSMVEDFMSDRMVRE